MKVDESGFWFRTDESDYQLLQNNPKEFWKGIVGITSGAFLGWRDLDLKTITIPGSVKNISERAFTYCESLENVVLEKGVEEIDVQAFMGCTKLKNITLSEGLKRIYAEAFKDCESLEEITFPANMQQISNHLFFGCNKLQRVTFKDGKNLPGNIQHILFGYNFNSIYVAQNGDVTFVRNIEKEDNDDEKE